MKNTIFKGAGVAIVTPFNDDGSINYDRFGEMIDYQIENKTDAIIVCGTTGESAAMSHEEHVECIKYCVDRVAKRIPVIGGAGSNDTAFAVRLAKDAERAGCDGLLCVTPYYNKTSQRGLVKHFQTVADSVDTPIILYSVPSRTGVTVMPETAYELSKHKNIVAIKEASGNIGLVAKIKALCGDDLDIYSGNDDMIVPVLSLGGAGVISVLSNVCPRETHDICELFFEGRVNESAKLQLELLDLINALFMDVNPIPVKDAMNIMGLNAGPCRMPLISMDDAHMKKMNDVLLKYGLIK